MLSQKPPHELHMQDRDFLKDMYLPANHERLVQEAAQGLESRLASFKACLSEGGFAYAGTVMWRVLSLVRVHLLHVCTG